jgi:outer membrane protein assembly factor BamB
MQNGTGGSSEAADNSTEETPQASGRKRRSRWVSRGLPIGAAALGLALAGTWLFSPWEHLSGADGTPPPPTNGVPAHGADRFRDAEGPVLVAGALVERHDGGVRAVNLRTGTTWWGINRPGRVHVNTVDRVDARRASIIWSDHRLTVVDVPSGHRVHIHFPSRSRAGDLERAVGLADRTGHPYVAVVQSFGVDTYDAVSGRRTWSRAAPNKCLTQYPGEHPQRTEPFLSLDVHCPDGLYSYDGTVRYDYAYSTLLDSSTGRPLPGFSHVPDGPLTPIGDHEILQASHRQVQYQVIDSRTGRTLWRLKLTTRSGSAPEVAGGQGLVVVTSNKYPEIATYRATDGKQLWHHTYYGTFLQFGAVINGQVRVVQIARYSVKVLTLDVNGRSIGTQELPMFEHGSNPRLIGGDYRTLVVQDTSAAADKLKNRYVLLTSTR